LIVEGEDMITIFHEKIYVKDDWSPGGDTLISTKIFCMKFFHAEVVDHPMEHVIDSF
jgi:hypothetical protein